MHKDRVYQSFRSLTGGSGQQCCYDGSGNIIVGPPGGGTVDQVSPDVSTTEHFFRDVLPFWLCCKAGIFSNCGNYYRSRPSDDCSRFVPPSLPGYTLGNSVLIEVLKTCPAINYSWLLHGHKRLEY